MANRKISDLTALTAPVTGDLLPIVDISEAAAADKNKKITYGTFLSSVPLGTAAAPSIAFTGDPNTGIYSPGADQVAISTNGAGRLFVDSAGKIGIGAASVAGLLQIKYATDVHTSFRNATAGGLSAGTLIESVNDAFNSYNPIYLKGSQFTFGTDSAGSFVERLRITAGGLVGIGTSGPLKKTEIRSTPATADTDGLRVGDGTRYLEFAQTGATYNYMQVGANQNLIYFSGSNLSLSTDGANAITLNTNSLERVRVTSAGNVGIGTTTPNVTGFGSTVATINVATGSNGGLELTKNNVAAGHFTVEAGASNDVRVGAVGGSAALTFQIGGSERGRFDSSGRLLVGTSTSTSTANVGSTQNIQAQGSSSLASISVIGNVASAAGGYLTLAKSRSTTPGGFTVVIAGDELGAISFEGADGSVHRVGASIGGVVDGTPGAGDMPGRLVFSTTADGASSPTERMRITSDGILLVGTTSLSTITGEAAAKTQVAGNFIVGNAVAATNVVATINGVVSKAGRIAFAESGDIKWLIGNGAASENGVFEIYDNVNGTGVQLAKSGTSWSAISDEREKDIIEPISNASHKVSSLRAIIGKYKTDQSGTRRSFLIAQDVQAVLPEAVDDTDPNKLGVRYTEVIPLLVAAIKEQQALIQALTERLSALEGA